MCLCVLSVHISMKHKLTTCRYSVQNVPVPTEPSMERGGGGGGIRVSLSLSHAVDGDGLVP